jgi:hypothetical protein
MDTFSKTRKGTIYKKNWDDKKRKIKTPPEASPPSTFIDHDIENLMKTVESNFQDIFMADQIQQLEMMQPIGPSQVYDLPFKFDRDEFNTYWDLPNDSTNNPPVSMQEIPIPREYAQRYPSGSRETTNFPFSTLEKGKNRLALIKRAVIEGKIRVNKQVIQRTNSKIQSTENLTPEQRRKIEENRRNALQKLQQKKFIENNRRYNQ